MNILQQDFSENIIKFLNKDFESLKNISETDKHCNNIIKNETQFKKMLEEKINIYNCDMVETYLIKILRPEILYYTDNNADVYKNKLYKYIKKLNKDCIDILYNKIDYCYNERNFGLNNYIQTISYVLSKKLFDIMVLIQDKLNYCDNDIIKSLSIKYS